MRHRLLPLVSIVPALLGLALASTAHGSAGFDLVLSGSGQGAVSVEPGGTYSLDVVVSDLQEEQGVDATLDSFTYRIVFPNPLHGLDQSRFLAPFDRAAAPDGFNGSVPLGDVATPVTSMADAGSAFATPLVADLYRTTASVAGVPAEGSRFAIEQLGLVAPLAPGDYPIQLSVAEAADAKGAFHAVTVGPPFVLQVPEPARLLQWVVGLAFVSLAVRRRGRAALCASLACGLLSGVLASSPATAAPFVPLEWQQEIVDVGPLLGERKHTAWSQDLDGDFVDDRFFELPVPAEKTQAIVQLSACQEAPEVIALLGAYGNVRQIGKLAGWVVLDDVQTDQLKSLALEPGVAAVEFPQPLELFLDTSTRSVRSRASSTYSPNTFEDAFGFDGTGIDIAIFDSGVDDAVHNGIPANVSGYNALTGTAGDPDDDNLCFGTGPNGIAATAAAGDDVQNTPVGQGTIITGPPTLFFICTTPGVNGVRDTPLQNDDLNGSGNQVLTGFDGICDSPLAGDDVLVIPVNQGAPNQCAVYPGPNGVVDAAGVGDDTLVTTTHGTHVSGIALGRGVGPGCTPADDGSLPNDCRGMAPGAGLIDVKVGGPSNAVSYTAALDGIDWLWTDGKAEVVNMSFGDGTNSDGTSAISQAINALVANGIAVSVASGNSSANALGQTASASLAVTVANSNDQATVNRTDDAISPTSTFGPRVDFDATNVFVGMLKPDLTAPGTNIFSAQGNSANAYQSISGTSMSSPHVAGAMALLLDMRADLPPGAMKDLLKRSAFVTPAQAAAGPSFPAVDATYNVNWGFGLLDLNAAGQALQAGVADASFPSCTGPHPDYPAVRRCALGGTSSWANSLDVTLATDPPVQGDPNTITVAVENRSGTAAQNVVVCMEVKELGVGLGEFYTVGCREVATLAAMGSTNVSIPWTPSADDHQCIQATIDYGFDTEFNNNTTQRNVNPIPSASPANGRFRVENPLNEPATIQYNIVQDDLVSLELLSPLPTSLGPENCPQVVDVQFFPDPAAQPGDVLPVEFQATAFSETYPDGIELSGVRFDVTIVKPGLNRDYAVAHHGTRHYRIPLGPEATSDPRREVRTVRAVFNVPMQPADPPLDPGDVQVESGFGSQVPGYTVSFEGGGAVGTELTIQFDTPLPDRDVYRFNFDSLVDLDGDPLTGVPSFDLRALAGDTDDSGVVDDGDLDYVRERINVEPVNSQAAGTDPNLTGSVTGTDISFVRWRSGNTTP